MQILITHSGVSKTQVLHFNRWQLAALVLLVVTAIMLFSGAIYSLVFLKAAREGWPIIGPAVRPLVQGESVQRDRFLRDNLDAMARKVGEMQAKLVKLEALGERVSAQAGVKPADMRPQDPPAAPKARARAGQGPEAAAARAAAHGDALGVDLEVGGDQGVAALALDAHRLRG